MPRPLIFSNGSLFVGIDDRYRIRDLFYPHVGLYNHLSGHAIRMGLWLGDRLTWVDEVEWSHELTYEAGRSTGMNVMRHSYSGIVIECTDQIHPQENVFRRDFTIIRPVEYTDELRLFFTHDLRLAETDIGDTAFYNPFLDGMIHYKGAHWIGFGGETSEGGIKEYATGIKGFSGHEGTWRDAEDGRLSMNSIAQGSVDSTIGFAIGPQAIEKGSYWIVCADSLDRIEEVWQSKSHWPLALVVKKDPMRHMLNSLPPSVSALCERSIQIVLAHCDHHGAILAAADSDIMTTNRANYCYCWPRDGAHVCTVLDRLGIHEPTRRFFRFCERMLSLDHPVLLQKYRPDGTLGATWHPWIVDGQPEIPFQEDESASVLHALGEHFRHTEDRMLLDELYPALVVPIANFLCEYREPGTGLPKPSYDLWEERRGVHLYTCAAVFAGLSAATKMARAFEDPRKEEYEKAAAEVRKGIESRFLPCLSASNPDSSSLFLLLYRVLGAENDAFAAHVSRIEKELWIPTEVGGLARYRGDYYFRVSQDLPGNPWIISTMWLAQCQIRLAKTIEDLERPLELLKWAAQHAATTQVLPEQLDPLTGVPLSVSPLTWSHAEVIAAALDWVEKRDTL